MKYTKKQISEFEKYKRLKDSQMNLLATEHNKISGVNEIYVNAKKERSKNYIRFGYDANTHQTAYIPYDSLFTHTLNLGASGMGKTALGISPIIQELMLLDRCGIIVFDPKSDLAREVYTKALALKMLGYIDENKMIDFFDPADDDCMYFNPLKGSLTDAKTIMQKMIDKIAPPTPNAYFQNLNDSALSNSITIVKQVEGLKARIYDLHQLLSNYEYANKTIAKAKQQLKMNYSESYQIAVDWLNDVYWANGEEGSKDKDNTSMTMYLEKFISDKTLSNIFNVTESEANKRNRKELDFEKYIKNKAILSITAGQETSTPMATEVLGAALILKLQAYYLSVPVPQRVDSMLFIDEFQVFANDGMNIFFQQGRSYKVAMHVATQSLQSLPEGIRTDVVTNTATKILHGSLDTADIQMLKGSMATTMDVEIATKASQNVFTGVMDEKISHQTKTVESSVVNESNMQSLQAKHIMFKTKIGLSNRKPKIIYLQFDGERAVPQEKELQKILENHYNNFISNMSYKVLDGLVNNDKKIGDFNYLDKIMHMNNLDIIKAEDMLINYKEQEHEEALQFATGSTKAKMKQKRKAANFM